MGGVEEKGSGVEREKDICVVDDCGGVCERDRGRVVVWIGVVGMGEEEI